jgi:gamma-glutamyltranspeptidase
MSFNAQIYADCRSGMQHSGIGGGGFMLIRDSNGNYESIGMPFFLS